MSTQNPKYHLLEDDWIEINHRRAYRVQALRAIQSPTDSLLPVHPLEKGGYIESVANLSQTGNAWVAAGAMVIGQASVRDSAWVMGASVLEHQACAEHQAWLFNTHLSQHSSAGYNAQLVDCRYQGQIWIYDQQDRKDQRLEGCLLSSDTYTRHTLEKFIECAIRAVTDESISLLSAQHAVANLFNGYLTAHQQVGLPKPHTPCIEPLLTGLRYRAAELLQGYDSEGLTLAQRLVQQERLLPRFDYLLAHLVFSEADVTTPAPSGWSVNDMLLWHLVEGMDPSLIDRLLRWHALMFSVIPNSYRTLHYVPPRDVFHRFLNRYLSLPGRPGMALHRSELKHVMAGDLSPIFIRLPACMTLDVRWLERAIKVLISDPWCPDVPATLPQPVSFETVPEDWLERPVEEIMMILRGDDRPARNRFVAKTELDGTDSKTLKF